MNQSVNGAVLFIILILIFALLFGLSWLRKPKNSASIKRQPFRKQSSNQRAIKTANLTKKQTKAKTKPGNKQSTHRLLQQSPTANRELKTLRNKIENDFPQFSAVLRQNYVLLKKTSAQNTTENIAMLTINRQIDIGRRRLGDVTVINFHSLPSCGELRIELQGL